MKHTAPASFNTPPTQTSNVNVNNMGGVNMSNTKVFEFPNKLAEREFFMARFVAYLRTNFRNPEHVAHDFGVRFQAALNWWNGDNCPTGIPVMKAMRDPVFIETITGAA